MNDSLLKKAYSPDFFRMEGHRLIDTLADHLEAVLAGNPDHVLQWHPPGDEHLFWKDFLSTGEGERLFETIISHSTHVHHVRCMGHQVCPPAPMASLAGLVSSMLNNGMAIYEMGMASSAIERIITTLLCEKAGYGKNSRGFLTSGGTLANLTALLTARKAKVKEDVWNTGTAGQLGIMVSEEAHYCIDRAARIMGLGEKGIIKVPVNANFAIDLSRLEPVYERAVASGIRVFAIVGSAPTTATGIFDNLEALASFSEKHGLWFHVDGAHGGAAILSPKYRRTVQGIERADSFVLDGHKMMMMPALTTALLYKQGLDSYRTFIQKADYLLVHSETEDWYNLAKRTFECTKNMMSIQWFALLKLYGIGLFEDYVNTLYDLGAHFGTLIRDHPSFELAVEPMSNIVCFRYVDPGREQVLMNRLNDAIRLKLLESGEFYVVQTKLREVSYLRVTFMNPFTTIDHLKKLLDLIQSTAQTLWAGILP